MMIPYYNLINFDKYHTHLFVSLQIVIPTGAFLNVRVANENSLDIWLYPSLQDFNMTEGEWGGGGEGQK